MGHFNEGQRRLAWAIRVTALVLVFSVPASISLCPSALAAQPNGLADVPAELKPPLQRTVSLDGTVKSRKEALEEVCGQAGVTLKLDVPAITAAGVDLNQSVSLKLDEEPLHRAIGKIIDRWAHLGIVNEVTGDSVHLTTLDAMQARTLSRLPDWLTPHYNHGLLADVDEAGNVVRISSGQTMTDELLARIATLTELRDLDIQSSPHVTTEGLACLATLPRLEKLQLYGMDTLKDGAIKIAGKIGSLRELSIVECGTTDDGIQLLERMPLLTSLKLRERGRFSEKTLNPIAKLTRLKSLEVQFYEGETNDFLPQNFMQLAALKDLEVLHLGGHAPPAEFVAFAKLRALSVGEVDETAAAHIAQCRNLQSLELRDSRITDDGLRLIAELPRLRQLNISSRFITDAGIAHLKALPELDHLTLRATGVTDESLAHLSQIKTLNRLDLFGSGLRGLQPGTNFTPAGLARLSQLPNLRTLWLTNCVLNGDTEFLKNFTQLYELTLMMTAISDTNLDALEDALPETTVHVASGSYRLPKRIRHSLSKAAQ